MKAWVDISIPGRHAEQYRLDDAGTTVGSSSSANIRLQGVSSLLAEHCSLRPQPEGCWVELIEHAREPFLHEGRPAREGMVAWGSDVYLGTIRITVNADLSKGAGKGPSPLVWVAALILPLVGLTFFLKPEVQDAASSAQAEPPALFGEMPACSEQKAGALGRAAVAEQIGRAKHERGVFVLEDAVAGTQLMREAAVCYALGDNQGSSDRALDEAEGWVDDLKYSYKRAQLDLDFGGGNIGLRLDAIARLNVLLRHAGPAADGFKAHLAQLRRNGFAEYAVMQEEAAQEKK
jgi:hypothetical protein